MNYKLKWLFLSIISIFIIFISCNQNPFTGVGTTVDMEPPKLTITSHVNNTVVTGTISLRGTATDNAVVKSVKAVRLYSQNGVQKEANVGTGVKTGSNWAMSIDTTAFPEGNNVIRVTVTDSSGKTAIQNVNLVVDNYGPAVIINQPEGRDTDIYFNPFTVALVCDDIGDVILIEWELYEEEDETNKITGTITGTINEPLAVNQNFIVDPSPLSDKMTSGVAILRIWGKDEKNQFSKDWSVKRLNIDFGNDIPMVTVSSPDKLSELTAQTYGKNIIISCYAEDDDAVKSAEIELINISAGNIPVAVTGKDFSASPKKQQPYTFSIELNDDGVYKFRTKVSDIYDTESVWSEYHYFKVNTTFPTVTFTSPNLGDWVKGTISVTAVANSHSVGGHLTKVEYKLGDNGTWLTQATPNLDEYNFNRSLNTVTEVLSGGEFKYYIKATDNNGAETTTFLLFNTDNMPPSGTIDTPGASNSNLNGVIRIQGTATDLIGTGKTGIVGSVELDIQGIGTVTPDGIASWSYDYDSSGVVSGTRLVTVTITDYSGNETEYTRTLNISQAADTPSVVITNLNDDDKIFGMFTLAGTASDDDAVKDVWIKIDPAPAPYDDWFKVSGTNSWSCNLNTNELGAGAKTIYYKSIDVYGKSSEYDPGGMVRTIDFSVDPDLPIIQLTSHTEGTAINQSVQLQGNVSKTTGLVSDIEIKIIGINQTVNWTTTGLVTSPSSPSSLRNYTYNLNTGVFGDGAISIYIMAKDDIDKVNTINRNLVIDTVKPTGELTLPAAGGLYVGDDGDGSSGLTGSLLIKGSCQDAIPSSGLTAADILLDLYYNGTSEKVVVADGSIAKRISGSVTNWEYEYDITAAANSIKDGLYKLVLTASDKAGNQPVSAIEVNNIRIARYRPKFSSLAINGSPVNQNMFVVKDCQFTGLISDNNGNDTVKGVQRVELYLTDNETIETGDTPFGYQDFTGNNDSETFAINYSFGFKKKYIIYRAIDKVGGITDYRLLVNIDYTKPEHRFTYGSRSFDLDFLEDSPGYSASLSVKLDAWDDNPFGGVRVRVRVGTTSGGSEILGEAGYNIGDTLNIDLREWSDSTIYLRYQLKDQVGNEVIEVIQIVRDGVLPAIESSALSGGYLRTATRNIVGTTTGGGQTIRNVYLSNINPQEDVGYNVDNVINSIVLNNASGGLNWSYSLPDTTDGDKSVIVYVVTSDGTNWYRTFNYTYDNTPPESTFNVMEVPLSNNGRVYNDSYVRAENSNNISGVVRFYGEYSDNYADRYGVNNVLVQIDLDAGTWTTIPSGNITRNPDDTFSWYYDYDTQNHANVVKNNSLFRIRVADVAGNYNTDGGSYSKTLNIKPYITTISENFGLVTPVIKYDNATSTWGNINDNQNYTYRLSGGNITINGFNLNASGNESILYTRNTGTPSTNTWSVNTGSNSNYAFNITWNASQLTNGNLRITVGGIQSNVKNITVIKNYSNDGSGYNTLEDMDMVIKDNLAHVVFQRHETSGSLLNRFKETAEGTYSPATFTVPAQASNLYHHYNRWWFVRLAVDSTFNWSTGQSDGGFYLLSSNSENAMWNGAGIQLSGSKTFWDTLSTFSRDADNPVKIQVSDTNETDYELRRNAWRISRIEGVANEHADQSNSIGDITVKGDKVYAVWFNQMLNKMEYRRFNNNTGTGNSAPSPVGAGARPIAFNVKGQFPSIALDTNGYPVIAAFDETNGNLVCYWAKNADPQNATTTHWDNYNIDTAGVVGVYPSIKIDTNGGVHIVYQDLTNSSMKYFYATSKANIGTGTYAVLDNDAAPGYYTDIQLDSTGRPTLTYLSYGYLGTQNAVRTMRWTGTAGVDSFTDRTKWERIILPAQRNISENKVRGYIATGDWLFGFAKSDRPEFFKERK